jgi:hypothetical protein
MTEVTYNTYFDAYIHDSIRIDNDKFKRLEEIFSLKNNSRFNYYFDKSENPLKIYKEKIKRNFLGKESKKKDSFLSIIQTKNGEFYIAYGFIGIEESDVISYKIDDFETLIQVLTYSDVPNSNLISIDYELIKAKWRDKQIDSILED